MPKQINCLPSRIWVLLVSTSMMICYACTNVRGDHGYNQSPAETQQQTSDHIRRSIEETLADRQRLADSSVLFRPVQVRLIYERAGYTPLWCHEQKWLSPGDSLFAFISRSQLFGLFPEDYHFEQLKDIREKFRADSNATGESNNPVLWSVADMLLTDAFMSLVHDIKRGRLPLDSLSENEDTLLTDEFFVGVFDRLQRGSRLTEIFESLEPRARGYRLLKQAIPQFLNKTGNRSYTQVPARTQPGFRALLLRRLHEGGYLTDSLAADSLQLAEGIKKFQQEKGLSVDGVAGEGTIRMLNVNDRERFIRVAISMDKYKMLPVQMPSRYIWVNASGNHLELIENGVVKLSSRVICGKPRTRTPLLTSHISELITYPQWVPPPSIVSREILPAVKKNPAYLSKKGFSLQDRDGNEVNPDSVDWSRFKTMPYRVVQGSGDANALGIMKFVFSNKYSVYLHDTNQRYLFGNSMRSLSHGCVRVQEWEKLAFYLISADNPGPAGNNRIDSVKTWLRNKQKRSISIRNRVPVYIRYFTCEGNENGISFYDDVYGEDKYLREKYFAGK